LADRGEDLREPLLHAVRELFDEVDELLPLAFEPLELVHQLDGTGLLRVVVLQGSEVDRPQGRDRGLALADRRLELLEARGSSFVSILCVALSRSASRSVFSLYAASRASWRSFIFLPSWASVFSSPRISVSRRPSDSWNVSIRFS